MSMEISSSLISLKVYLYSKKKEMFEIDFREILTVGMVLFAVIDIVGSIPIIVDLRTKHGHIESEKASLVAGVIMIVFLFIGEEFLKVIGIDVHSFAVAGSLSILTSPMAGSVISTPWCTS